MRVSELPLSLSHLLQNAHKVPPPWLIAMQRYGPPPSYPNLKIPGLNSPIPEVRQLLPPQILIINQFILPCIAFASLCKPNCRFYSFIQTNKDDLLVSQYVSFFFFLFCLLELYVWLSRRRLGEAASR